MIKLTWLSEELHAAYERELERLLEDQGFLEHFFALTRLLNAASEQLNEAREVS